ncbi:MAG: hypothetical protein H6930_00920 [Rhodoferax sp.]|jgi:hypothetical protein|nr:hypothetical protein [Rhodoferax sp.]
MRARPTQNSFATVTSTKSNAARTPVRLRRSFLAWPAWQRVLAVLPALGLLWLAVLWASMDSLPW